MTSSALAVREDQDDWLPEQTAALQAMGIRNASPAELKVFLAYCQRSGLDPWTRQIYLVPRAGKQTVQVAIDGLRLIARKAVEHAGQTLSYEDTLWCGPDGNWSDVWLGPGKPYAAKVTVLRNGERFPAVARVESYEDPSGPGWKKAPDNQIAKCAEALALRKACPQDLSGIYTEEEMARDDNKGGTTVVQERPARLQQRAVAAKSTPAQSPPEGSEDERDLLEMVAGTDTIEIMRQWWKENPNAKVRSAIEARIEFIRKAQEGELVDAEVLEDPFPSDRGAE